LRLFIILKPEFKGQISEQNIIDWVAKRISAYKKIHEVGFVDTIPKSGSSKTLQRELIEQEKKKLGLK
ncbi:unnamed protein product, partial [marine sediment metagenome]